MKRLWRNYSLSITLAGLFFVSWIGQLVTQWFTWANDQQEHNQPLEVGNFLLAARPLLSPGGPGMPKVDRRTALSRSWGPRGWQIPEQGWGAVSCWVDAAAVGYHRRWMSMDA